MRIRRKDGLSADREEKVVIEVSYRNWIMLKGLFAGIPYKILKGGRDEYGHTKNYIS